MAEGEEMYQYVLEIREQLLGPTTVHEVLMTSLALQQTPLLIEVGRHNLFWFIEPYSFLIKPTAPENTYTHQVWETTTPLDFLVFFLLFHSYFLLRWCFSSIISCSLSSEKRKKRIVTETTSQAKQDWNGFWSKKKGFATSFAKSSPFCSHYHYFDFEDTFSRLLLTSYCCCCFCYRYHLYGRYLVVVLVVVAMVSNDGWGRISVCMLLLLS